MLAVNLIFSSLSVSARWPASRPIILSFCWWSDWPDIFSRTLTNTRARDHNVVTQLAAIPLINSVKHGPRGYNDFQPSQTETQIDKSDHTHTHTKYDSTDVQCVQCTFAVSMALDSMCKHHGPGPLSRVDFNHKREICVFIRRWLNISLSVLGIRLDQISHTICIHKWRCQGENWSNHPIFFFIDFVQSAKWSWNFELQKALRCAAAPRCGRLAKFQLNCILANGIARFNYRPIYI